MNNKKPHTGRGVSDRIALAALFVTILTICVGAVVYISQIEGIKDRVDQLDASGGIVDQVIVKRLREDPDSFERRLAALETELASATSPNVAISEEVEAGIQSIREASTVNPIEWAQVKYGEYWQPNNPNDHLRVATTGELLLINGVLHNIDRRGTHLVAILDENFREPDSSDTHQQLYRFPVAVSVRDEDDKSPTHLARDENDPVKHGTFVFAALEYNFGTGELRINPVQGYYDLKDIDQIYMFAIIPLPD